MFLPIVVAAYWSSNLRVRHWIILASSLLFYGFWKIEFLPLMIVSASFDYFASLAISQTDNRRRRKTYLVLAMTANLVILGFFKYLIFFRDTIWSIAEFSGYQPSFVELNIILPLGISFYTFQTMSYTIDVYRREIPPERDWLKYLCFVTFFPQLVAGPIVRAGDLLPQLQRKLSFSTSQFVSGLECVIAGLLSRLCLLTI